MFGKKQVKGGIKVLYLLIQLFIMLSGISMLLFSWTVFYRSSSLLNLNVKSMIPITTLGLISIAHSILGYKILSNSEDKTNSKLLFFLFLFSLAAILNLNLIEVIRSNRFVEKNNSFTNSRWNALSDVQRNFIQEKLECCGFETINDRKGSKCIFQRSCSKVFMRLGENMRNWVQMIFVTLFFIETIGMCMIGFLKFGRMK